MKKFWIIISVCWLWTCGGGGGGSSPTEPQEPAPVSNFTATPTTLIQGQAVTFTSTSTGTITSYAWNVDNDPAIDGTTATYSHTYTEVGTYSVTLTVTGPGGSNPKTVADMITVSTAAPTPTTATSQTVQEDGSTTISLTATDPNGQAVTFAITTDPTNGTATLSGTEITYTPNANFYGTDTFAYTASNGTYTSDPVTITITVEGQDDEPTTNDVSATTDEDTSVTLTLDATEIDGDNYSFSIISQPTNGTLGSIDGNQVEYTPNQDFNGTDTFTFEATDDRTFRRNVATATITVNPVNDAPVANDVTASMNENKEFTRLMPVTITLDATDVEGDDLTYSIVGTPSNGTLGSITNNQVIYTPSQDYNGEDTFTYKANDGTADSNTATVTVTVTSVNDAPVTEDQSASTDEDTAVDITLTATDVENDNLTFTIVSDVSNGTTSLSGATVTYTPTANFNGTDTFTFKANDGTDDSNTSTVTITVASVNDAPVANDVTASTQSRTGNMRQAVNITLDATDVDGDDLTYSLVSDVSNGTTSLSGNIVTYTPTANYDGTDTFTYKANDGTADSNTATGTITITDVNNAPIANDVILSMMRINKHASEEFSQIEFEVSGQDLDEDSLSKTLVSSPSHGNLIPQPGMGYKYELTDAHYFGSDSFTYKLNDGIEDSNLATVIITIEEGAKRIFENYDTKGMDVIKSINNSFLVHIMIDDENATSQTQDFLADFDVNGEIVNQVTFDKCRMKNTGGSTPDAQSSLRRSGDKYILGSCGSSSKINIFDSSLTLVNEIDFDTNGSIEDVEITFEGDLLITTGGWNILKVDSSGNLIYSQDVSSFFNHPPIFIEELSDGDLIVATGERNDSGELARLSNDAQSIRWVTNFGSSNDDRIQGLEVKDDEIFLMHSGQGGVHKYDTNGNKVYQTAGGGGDLKNDDILIDTNGNIYVTSRSSFGDTIYASDSSGSALWSADIKLYPYSVVQGARIDGISLDSNENIVVAYHSSRLGWAEDNDWHVATYLIIDKFNGDILYP